MSAALRDEAKAFTADALPSTTRARPRPAPIPYPSRPHVEELCRTRANGDNARWERQVEQRSMLMRIAHDEGYNAGERVGYLQGWHWGCACGVIAGGAAIGLLWLAWAPMQRVLGAWGLA